MAQYKIFNGPMPTTAKFAKVATGTSIKTMLQVKASSTVGFHIVEWGISFDGASAVTPGTVELIQTDVAATVTASAAADIIKYDAAALMGGDQTTNLIPVGTTSTGYTSSGEGSITAIRLFDVQQLPPTAPYVMQFPLGHRPFVEIAKFARVRVHMGTDVNVICYMLIEV